MDEVAKQVYVETAYDGVNVGAMVTPTGIVCIDVPSYARDARDWAARMHRLSPYPVLNIVLTDSSGDRVLNTRWLNAPIVMQQHSADVLASYDKRFPPQLLESLSMRNPHRGRELSSGPVEHPTMSFSGEIVMFRHGQQIVLKAAPGPTAGTSWVILPERGVVFAGDTLQVDTHPHLMEGETCAAWITTLENLREMVRTHTIVPGRGGVLMAGDESGSAAIDAAIEYHREMLTRVTDHIERGLPQDAIVSYIPEFMGKFPIGSLPVDWVRHNVKISLGFVYDEVQSGL